MNAHLLKKAPLAIAALATSSMAYAGMDMDARVSQLEQQMRQVRTETAMGTYGSLTAPARPDVDGHGFKFNFDILYWHARLGGTEFCYTDSSTTPGLPFNGAVKEIDFKWDWGFMFGAGYNFEHDNWDINANYTCFKSSGSTGVAPGSGSITIPLKGWSGIPEGAGGDEFFIFSTSAKSQAKLNLDAVDIELGRAYFMSADLSFRPHFGLKTVWIKNNQTTFYTGGTSTSPVMGFPLGDQTIYVKDYNKFWGLGPRTGFNSKWYLANGFSIYGNASAALLFGQFKVRHREDNSITSPGDRTGETINLTGNMHRFVPTAQLSLGLAYGTYVFKKEQYIEFSLGYDCQYFWRVNQFLRVVDQPNIARFDRYSEDLAYQGVTGQFTWEF